MDIEWNHHWVRDNFLNVTLLMMTPKPQNLARGVFKTGSSCTSLCSLLWMLFICEMVNSVELFKFTDISHYMLVWGGLFCRFFCYYFCALFCLVGFLISAISHNNLETEIQEFPSGTFKWPFLRILVYFIAGLYSAVLESYHYISCGFARWKCVWASQPARSEFVKSQKHWPYWVGAARVAWVIGWLSSAIGWLFGRTVACLGGCRVDCGMHTMYKILPVCWGEIFKWGKKLCLACANLSDLYTILALWGHIWVQLSIFLCPIKNDSSYSICQTKCSVIKIKKVYSQVGGWFAFFDINCSLKANFGERHFILAKCLLWVFFLLFFFFSIKGEVLGRDLFLRSFCRASKLSNFSTSSSWLCFWLTLVSV